VDKAISNLHANPHNRAHHNRAFRHTFVKTLTNMQGKAMKPWLAALWIALASPAFAGPAQAAPAQAIEIPAALQDWQAWVMHGLPQNACPRAQRDGERPVCTLYGSLQLQVNAQGGSFSVGVSNFSELPLALPGRQDQWPQQVEVDAVRAPVLAIDGIPHLQLPPGTHQISGRFEWSRRPEQLTIPASMQQIRLRVDGLAIEPVQRAGNTLWLGRAVSSERQTDALQTQVYRHIQDGAPAIVTTLLRLQVTGKAREEVFSPMLLEGLEPLNLASNLRAELDPQGALRVQVRPGSFELVLSARLLQPLSRLVRPNPGAQWPESEIWSYAAAPELRMTEAEAESVIDPTQANVPEAWRGLPAFVLEPGQAVEIREVSRGKTGDESNTLSLQRELWLRFDGSQWLGRDQLNGQMRQDWRIDLRAPLQLERASSGGEPLLITQGENALRGVEWRERNADLDASWSAKAAKVLPVSGWNQSLESANWRINLPPGWRLLAATGADRSAATWWGQWRLFDAFGVAFLAVLGFRLLGMQVGIALGLCLILVYFEPNAPVFSLGLLVLAALLARAFAGATKPWFMLGQGLILALFLLNALPFALQQLTHVLYPQLERDSVRSASEYRSQSFSFGSGSDAPENAPENEGDMAVMDQMAPAAPPPESAFEVTRESSNVVPELNMKQAPQMSNQAANRRLERYSKGSRLQAGNAEPDWIWGANDLVFSGPIAPEQQVRLILLSPFWSGLWQLAGIVLLVLSVALLVRAAVPRRKGLGTAAALALLLLGSQAQAQNGPSTELLDELRTRLTRAPECMPHCAHVAHANLRVRGRELVLELEVHAAARIAVPLPYANEAYSPLALAIDDQDAGSALNLNGEPETVLERGVHQVTITARIHAEQLTLRFPLSPAQVSIDAPGFEAGGLRDGQLLSDTLELVQKASADADRPSVELKRIAPFVRVTRELTFNMDWEVQTTVQRLAPQNGGFNVAIPLIAGERLLSEHVEIDQNAVEVAFAPGESMVQYASQLDPVAELVLTAPNWNRHAESWIVTLSPIWQGRFSGLPALQPDANASVWQQIYAPLPGESLKLELQRAEQVPGDWLAIDQVSLSSSQGERLLDSTLVISLRSTQAGTYALQLPSDAEIRSITLNNQVLNLRSSSGALRVPLNAGKQNLMISLRQARDVGAVMRFPEIDLLRASSNIRLNLQVPHSRWLLHASGPALGPVVLYWPGLLLLLASSWYLLRRGWITLKPLAAVLVAAGFSTVAWQVWALILVWLALLNWRARGQPPAGYWQFNLMQLAVIGLTGLTLLVMAGALVKALLGSPDMHIVGNDSYASNLRWFADHSAGPLPGVSVYSAPMWLYQALMLAFSLWLALTVMTWLKQAWLAFNAGGRWRTKPPAQGVDPDPPQSDVESASETALPSHLEPIAQGQAPVPDPPPKPA